MSSDSTPTSTTDTTTATTKPGYKTTEFWLSAITSIVGLIIASGAVPAGSNLERIIGLAAATLASLGYSASRANVKAS